ncbi:acyl-CoA dehydrogenase [Persicimonas caeni]|uniref:Acyl-CoA dehydrogenase n=1 Tax=Persicimonas caeni TaxID=2292766 RepID=A0A4Y6PXR2_PERCE|nr:acyl-CoA dehydrogenase [Persicimonas caeni]QDG53053.1 acyl-CoA dehydrogenase [Persicimonas caeni]QED34275.1 acyl-CoA dehydrogenase [Persicimonas caeni]
MSDIIDRRDLDFLLYDCLHVDQLTEHPYFADHNRQTFEAVVDTAIRIARDKFEPHAAKLDREPPSFDGDRVHIIPEVAEAIEAFTEAGFLSASFDADDGGMQLPYSIAQAYMAVFYAANCATAGYPLLTLAAANLLATHATDEQKERFLEPMLQGRFFGTMCLSEPQAGSSLTDIETVAEPLGAGRYKIRGNKMWISGGDHELGENIVHLVLAKIPGGPPGVKGISLFIVPKMRLDDAGNPAEPNDVSLTGLNHKMGFRGTINTALNFGENDDCIGWLVGEEHQGLRYMFHMMNEARIGVGLGATMLGHAGYQHSLEYAKERPQGRPAADKDPTSEPVPIIEHADVRRMLLAQKAATEGALMLGLFCARLVDDIKLAEVDEDTERAEQTSLLLDLLTPIAKAWPSEHCLEANKLAIQVMGGYGYSSEYPVERLYRDNRLNAIHEGTNGIQALDLLGRKVTMKNGAALQLLLGRVNADIERARQTPELVELADALETATQQAAKATMTLTGAAMQGKVDLFLANASVYLEMLGHIVIAWMWLQQATIAHNQLDEDGLDTAREQFLHGKLQAARYFFRWELPKVARHSELLSSLDDTTLSMQPEWF